MAGGSVVTNIDEGEILVLKEALQSQQQLLQKLYVELEAEREASSSAANETLSKIWRLQEEKAAEKMEASQYKRMVEEKMKYAEASMAMFEEIVFQKEMEICSLEYEMEAYKCKLLSVGFNERMIGEGVGGFLTSCGEADFDDFSSPLSVRRIRSLPVGFNDPSFKLLDLDMQRPVDGGMDSELEFGGNEMQKKSEKPECDTLRSYWEQIKRLEERMKALSPNKDVKEKVDSVSVSSNKKLQSPNMGYPEEVVSSSCSAVRRNLVHDRIKGVRTRMEHEGSSPCSTSRPNDPMNTLEFDRHDSQSLESESIRNIDQSTSICDVYEVPVISDSETVQSHGSQKQPGKQVVFDGWNEHESDPILKEANEYCCKDETEWVKKVLQYDHHDKKMSKPCLKYHWDGADTKTSTLTAHCEIQEIDERLELFGIGQTLKRKLSCGGEEGLRMLKVIHEQLKTIKSELREIKNKNRRPPDEPSLDSIREAMFFYSL